VLTATFNSYLNRQITTPHTQSIPQNQSTKNRHSWLRSRKDPYTKFGRNPFTGGFWASG